MESSKILQSDVLDIIFEQKNKQYGAYELRKNYHKRARKAVMIVTIFAIVASAVPLIAGLLIDDDHAVRYTSRTVHINPALPAVPPPSTPAGPPPITQPPSDAATATTAPPVIVAADSVAERDLLSNQTPVPQPNNGPAAPEGPAGPGSLVPGAEKEKTEKIVLELPPVADDLYEAETLEQLPEFPGGDDAMAIFLKDHLKYPKRALEAGEAGKVVLEFVINKDGKISDIDFLRKAGFGFDDEAKRVMELMPEWKPGKMNGKPVKAKFQIPIKFELQE